MKLDAKIPDGPLEDKWTEHQEHLRLVGPRNRAKYRVLVIGSGLAGASAAASMAAMGYKVECFCFQDTPRRAHSIAAQGGINASKNYRNDGDSTFRLFYDTQKGGDYRSREANVYRLAECSTKIIDQAVAQGVPFAREYGGMLANRSFGGVLVERTFYCRGETGQQLLLGAYSALAQEIGRGHVKMHTRAELLDLVIVDGRCRGIVTRDLSTGAVESHAAEAVVLATGGYSNVYYLSTNAKGCNVTAAWRAYKRGAGYANPSFQQIHPTSIPEAGKYQSKLTLMSESLRNDGRIWVPRQANDERSPSSIPEKERYYYLEERYPRYGNLVPRDVASRNAKQVCDEGLGVGPGGRGVFLDFRDAIKQHGESTIGGRYSNLFSMYERITGDSPWNTPMRIYPAPHYSMGGLWVDYDLMTTVPGLFAIGEANFSDHGANRLGASSLMQCLADGYFVIPVTIGDYLSSNTAGDVDTSHAAFAEVENDVRQRVERLLSIDGSETVADIHRDLGRLIWDTNGISRSRQGLERALEELPTLSDRFWNNVRVPGHGAQLNQSLEHAGRLADFLEFAEAMCLDALTREESCGCHFREEHQTEEGEALRDDENFAHVAVWKYEGDGQRPSRHVEPLEFDAAPPTQRNYKT